MAAVILVYTVSQSGVRVDPQQLGITSSATERSTNALSLMVSGTLRDTGIKTVTLVTNGSRRPVTVQNGTFQSRVPLIAGENTIQAITRKVASNPIKVVAQIPPADIWIELSWIGPGDIDLHLALPNGEHCFYSKRETPSGAILDFDNTQRDGPEHIVMNRAIEGSYRADVVYFSAPKQPPDPVDWQVNFRLRNGKIQESFAGRLNNVGEEQEVFTFKFP